MKKICYPPGHKLFKSAWDLMSVKLFQKEMRLGQDRQLVTQNKRFKILCLN